MCGRFYMIMDEETGAERMVYPTEEVEVLTKDGWRLMTWGLPDFSGKRHINARAETVAEKPTFRDAFRHRRCLVPASGYLEWRRQHGKKTKDRFRLFREDGEKLMMAGIFTENGEFAVVTQAPNAVVASIHDRMPVIVPTAELQTLWLHNDDMAEIVLSSYPDPPMKAETDYEDPQIGMDLPFEEA